MFNKHIGLLTLLIVLTGPCLFVPDTKAASEEGCVTARCHSAMLKGKSIHPVAEPCDTCHQSAAAPHPQKGKSTFKLIQDVPGLCTMCHQPFGKREVHPPVKDGMCTTCHNPHGADEEKLLVQPKEKLCAMCHPDKTSHKYMHGPTAVGDCTICHVPHDSDNKRLVVKEGNELCFMCHGTIEDEMKKKAVHPALLGGCTSCHNPHGEAFPKLLSAEGEKLCFQCHPQIGEVVEKAKSVHAPLKSEKACASCHSPHASENEKLLARPGKDLCLGCHKDLIKKSQTVIHGPIKAGKCTPCHNPHGSPNARLLLKEFPGEIYVPYSEKEYELCFSCHNRDLLRFPDTSFATGFRDGERNLHFLHVNKKDKGRSCRICHNMHASERPRLIADGVAFGKWSLPLKFVKTETGGSCSPGCHKKYNYDRKTPGKEPQAAEKEKKK